MSTSSWIKRCLACVHIFFMIICEAAHHFPTVYEAAQLATYPELGTSLDNVAVGLTASSFSQDAISGLTAPSTRSMHQHQMAHAHARAMGRRVFINLSPLEHESTGEHGEVSHFKVSVAEMEEMCEVFEAVGENAFEEAVAEACKENCSQDRECPQNCEGAAYMMKAMIPDYCFSFQLRDQRSAEF